MNSNKTTEPLQPGDFDPAFNDGKLVVIPGDVSNVVTIDPEGKIYVAGAVGSARGGYFITALNPDGTRNQDFNNGESVTNDFMPDAYSMGFNITVLPDGKILLVGLTQNYSSGPIMLGLARYQPDGTLDQSFGISGHLVPVFDYQDIKLPEFIVKKDSTPDYLHINPRLSCVIHNGNIFVAMKGIHNQKNLTLIMQFDEQGYFIKEFGNNGTAVIEHPEYNTVLTQALIIDQHLYLAGYLGSSSRGVLRAWARVNMSGELDIDFGADGFIFDTQGSGEIDKFVLQKNSKLLGCGGTGVREAVFASRGMLVSLNRDGTQDMEFNEGQPVIQPIVDNKGSFWRGCAIQPDARIVTCGLLAWNVMEIIVGRFLPNGKPDPTFNGEGWIPINLGKDVSNVAMALQNNNAIVVTGSMNTDPAPGSVSFVFQLQG
ncbi:MULTISPECIES: hypothetical protein [Pseudomonas]|uniref:hypothetical protein n=1 Tax=Pseudomonas TaxID=286 RepID=UPI00070E4217|nr:MULTISPECIES: hypothetical protein [Pseudomonas]KQW40877.1 hypothetical protein ASC85_16345 [Pseudomonas sp. Root401]WHS54703.1 hypothetical protein QLH64_01645 [Pseudomonas brassicacearum]